MGLALETIKSKGQAISFEEEQGVIIAILLHDIGHGPFSHALEHTIVDGVSHEHISTLLMNNLNREFGGKLGLAIEIFNNRYHKKFLYQLVSGQLDLDRMDYLNRDSFFTGVSEGVISFDRIIKMLDVVDDQLVVEEKGIYSIEKFLIARRLMYWQVYLHKTVIAAEQMLVKILERAKEITLEGRNLFASPCFSYFLKNSISMDDFQNNPKNIERFTKLDDNDIFTSIKVWVDDEDLILSTLCAHIIDRNLYQVEITNEPPSIEKINDLAEKVTDEFEISDDDTSYFVFTDTIKNKAYSLGDGSINILMKDGSIQDIASASDYSNLEALSKTVEKYILCYLKELKYVK
jgi:HD superfamily phosphohydrolase